METLEFGQESAYPPGKDFMAAKVDRFMDSLLSKNNSIVGSKPFRAIASPESFHVAVSGEKAFTVKDLRLNALKFRIDFLGVAFRFFHDFYSPFPSLSNRFIEGDRNIAETRDSPCFVQLPGFAGASPACISSFAIGMASVSILSASGSGDASWVMGVRCCSIWGGWDFPA